MASISPSTVWNMDMVIATIKGAKTYIYALVTLMMWDWAVCLSREYRLIWQKERSALSMLHVATRYLGNLLLLLCVVFYSTTWTEGACKSIHHFQPIAYAFLQMLCQAAFIYITWELLGQFCLSLLLATCFVIELVILAIGITRFEPYVMPPQAHNGCISSGGIEYDPLVMAFFLAPLAFHTIHGILLSYFCFKYFKEYTHITPKEFLIRFQLPFYSVVFICHLANVITYLQSANKILRPLGSPVAVIGTVIMTCRTILNLKSDRASPLNSSRLVTRVIPGSGTPQPLPEKLKVSTRSISFLDPDPFAGPRPISRGRKITLPSFGGRLFDFESKVEHAAGARPQTAGTPFRNLRSAKGNPGSFGGVEIVMTSVYEEEGAEADLDRKDRESLDIQACTRESSV